MDNNIELRQETAPQTPPLYVAQPAPKSEDTPQTKRMKENFGFFGPVTLLYAAFYAFCMFRNGSGVTFPFFVAASLLYMCFSLSKLEITLKKGSAFYMISMMMLAVSTFCTDDGRIIFFNKAGIFLLTMSFLLKQFYNTSDWRLGKYLSSIFAVVFASIGELGAPFKAAAAYLKKNESQKSKTLWYVLIGAVVSVPLLILVLVLLSGADAVFRQMTDAMLQGINVPNIVNVVFRVVFLFFAAYLSTAYLCRHTLKEQVTDRRTGEPVLAITVTSLLTVVYLLFSVIQIVYLFLGRMELPEGYTYAEYAREGFFQLLAVGILNLVIVLAVMNHFRESKVLKVVLTVMSLCTFIMIASSAVRMIIYIRFYYLTFLRILVLWGLALLFLLFVGVILDIYNDCFPLFQYSTVVVTALYLILSFSHPDYIIASVNVGNVYGRGAQKQFFLVEEPYHDYAYLSGLNADAAPVLIPYMKELGYDMGSEPGLAEQKNFSKYQADGFGYWYLRNLKRNTENFGVRTFNISRYMALKQMEKH